QTPVGRHARDAGAGSKFSAFGGARVDASTDERVAQVQPAVTEGTGEFARKPGECSTRRSTAGTCVRLGLCEETRLAASPPGERHRCQRRRGKPRLYGELPVERTAAGYNRRKQFQSNRPDEISHFSACGRFSVAGWLGDRPDGAAGFRAGGTESARE